MLTAEKAIEGAVGILRENLETYTTEFQASNTVGNVYPQSENVGWTTGFLTGEYWLAYELTGDRRFEDSALVQVDSFLDRIERQVDVDNHDMGFLYTPSCVAAYKLVGSETGRRAALLAADRLASRFREKGAFIQAWGELGSRENYRLIIDCLLNLPLLYWATEVTGDRRYATIARRHTATSLSNLLREDNSTYHTYFFDPESGLPTVGVTRQGYRDDSAWARGQAWGIYGTALAYRYTGDPYCLDCFRKVTDFFFGRLPEDGIPYWDLEFGEGSAEPPDSSAAAIAVCGILEMLPNLGPEEASCYRKKADFILDSLIRDYANRGTGNGLLMHGVYAKSSPYNPVPRDRGVDECNAWGDYFYLEALARNAMEWDPYW